MEGVDATCRPQATMAGKPLRNNPTLKPGSTFLGVHWCARTAGVQGGRKVMNLYLI